MVCSLREVYILTLDAALVAALTLEEKSSLFVNHAAAVPRLNWPAFNWWSEALHGVARDGVATSWPQVPLLVLLITYPALQVCTVGAAFNDTLFHALGALTSTEARGKSAGLGETRPLP